MPVTILGHDFEPQREGGGGGGGRGVTFTGRDIEDLGFGPPAEVEKPHGVIIGSVLRGIDNLQGTLYGAGAIVADYLDEERASDWFIAQYLRNQAEAAENPAEVKSWRDIEGVGDAATYTIEAIFENLPMMIPSMVTGGGASLLAGAGRKAVAYGIGAYAGNWAQEAGSIYGDIYQETGKKEPGVAAAYATPAALLDTLAEIPIASKLIPKGELRAVAGVLGQGVAKEIEQRLSARLGKAGAQQFLLGGGTEGIQTAIERAALSHVDPLRPFWTAQLFDEIVDSVLKGGISEGTLAIGAEALRPRQPSLRPAGAPPLMPRSGVVPPVGRPPGPGGIPPGTVPGPGTVPPPPLTEEEAAARDREALRARLAANAERLRQTGSPATAAVQDAAAKKVATGTPKEGGEKPSGKERKKGQEEVLVTPATKAAPAPGTVQPPGAGLTPEAEKTATESTAELLARTTVGEDRNRAFAERRAAVDELLKSLKPGDKVINENGDVFTVRENLSRGDFVLEEAPEGIVSLIPEVIGGRIERVAIPPPAATPPAAAPTAKPPEEPGKAAPSAKTQPQGREGYDVVESPEELLRQAERVVRVNERIPPSAESAIKRARELKEAYERRDIDALAALLQVRIKPPAKPSEEPGKPPAAKPPAVAPPAAKPPAAKPPPETAPPAAKPPAAVPPGEAPPKKYSGILEEDQDEMARLIAELTSLMPGQEPPGAPKKFQMALGPDPKFFVIGARIAGLYIKSGIRKFTDFAARFKADHPQLWDAVKGFLRGIWTSAEASHPEIEEVSRAEAEAAIANLDRAAPPGEAPEDVEPGGKGEGGRGGPGRGGPTVTGPTGGEQGTGGLHPQPGGTLQPGVPPADEGGAGEPGGGDSGVTNAPPDRGPGEPGSETTDEGAGAGGTGTDGGLRGPQTGVRGEATRTGSNLRLTENPAPTTAVARIKANIEAIEVVRALEGAGRAPTEAEIAKLAAWSGWGSFKELFNVGRAERRDWDTSWTAKYGKYYDQLQELLTEEEFNAAAESSVNAHYTSKEVVDFIWRLADQLGFRGGNILEPSAGSGVVIGYAPDQIANNSRWTAVEMDLITGKILSYLYPQADTRIQGFQDTKIPNGHYDLAVSNIPFHETGPGKEYPDLNLHNYFIARMLDKVRPGGLVIVITTKNTMDARPLQRELLVGKGELVGAIRLPNNAFKESADTSVVTDIIVLRKPDGRPFDAQQWLNQTNVAPPDSPPINVNEYFAANPGMVLGRHSLSGSNV